MPLNDPELAALIVGGSLALIALLRCCAIVMRLKQRNEQATFSAYVLPVRSLARLPTAAVARALTPSAPIPGHVPLAADRRAGRARGGGRGGVRGAAGGQRRAGRQVAAGRVASHRGAAVLPAARRCYPCTAPQRR